MADAERYNSTEADESLVESEPGQDSSGVEIEQTPPRDLIPEEEFVDDVTEREFEQILVRNVSRAVVREFRSVRESFVGPLPPPQMFEHYEKVSPGAGNAILAMAQDEQKHRHESERSDQAHAQIIEKQIVAGNEHRATWGLWLGFILAVIIIVGGIFLSFTGRETAGLIQVVTAMVGLIGIFVGVQVVRRFQRKDDEIQQARSESKE